MYDFDQRIKLLRKCLILCTILSVMTGLFLAWSWTSSSSSGEASASAPAAAFARRAGCGATYTKVGSPTSPDMGNLLGGVHSSRMEMRTQDCIGYDLVDYYYIRMTKDSGRCSNGGLQHINNYDFNPDTLSGYNPGTRTVDCVGGKATYIVTFDPPGWLRIDNEESVNQRCIGAAWQIDKGPIVSDYNGTIPRVCLDGL